GGRLRSCRSLRLLLERDYMLLVELIGETSDLDRMDEDRERVVLCLAAHVRAVRSNDRPFARRGPVRRAFPCDHAVDHPALCVADLMRRGLADREAVAHCGVPAREDLLL